MADTFLVLRTNDTSPQLFWHDGQNIDPTGLGALPAATLESLAGFGGSRNSVRPSNRVFTFLDMTFVLQNGVIYKSTDEAATFVAVHTLTGTVTNAACQHVGPVPVMVQGALKLVGFYLEDATGNIFVMEYDFAGDSWTSANTGVTAGGGLTHGQSAPVVFNGLVYARVGVTYVAYDPVSTGTVTLTNNDLSGTYHGCNQFFTWNGGLWVGTTSNGGITPAAIVQVVGSTLDISANGISLPVTTPASDFPAAGSKNCIFVDPDTGNLIVWATTSGVGQPFYVWRITPGAVVTDITGTVVGAGLTTLGEFGVNTRFWPHITRVPGGDYNVVIYASRGPNTTDPVERFEWVDDATPITEVGVVGGSSDIAFPYAIHGGDYSGFFAGEKRVMQTAQAANASGIAITFEAYQQSGAEISVRGHFDKVGATSNPLTLAPMTIGNPSGDPGLAISGANPGAQVDNVPTNRTPITMDWDQVTDGFVTGDNYNYQLEAL